MTIPLMAMIWSGDSREAEPQPQQCGTCGDVVDDMEAHRKRCVDHELEQFTAGRRAS